MKKQEIKNRLILFHELHNNTRYLNETTKEQIKETKGIGIHTLTLGMYNKSTNHIIQTITYYLKHPEQELELITGTRPQVILPYNTIITATKTYLTRLIPKWEKLLLLSYNDNRQFKNFKENTLYTQYNLKNIKTQILTTNKKLEQITNDEKRTTQIKQTDKIYLLNEEQLKKIKETKLLYHP